MSESNWKYPKGWVLTQESLKELVHYEPSTGVFTSRVNRGSSQVKVGKVLWTYVDTSGYHQCGLNKKLYYAHRLAHLYMVGSFPINQIDHINGIRTDNRWVNLRDVTNQENNRNRSKDSNNTSGVTGVHWHKGASKWEAQIGVSGKTKYLGYFTDKQEAIKTRKEAEIFYGFHKNHGRI